MRRRYFIFNGCGCRWRWLCCQIQGLLDLWQLVTSQTQWPRKWARMMPTTCSTDLLKTNGLEKYLIWVSFAIAHELEMGNIGMSSVHLSVTVLGFHHSERSCITHVPTTSVLGQGHIYRSKARVVYCVLYISVIPHKDYHEAWVVTTLSAHTAWSNNHVRSGHAFRSKIKNWLYSASDPYLLNHLKQFHETWVKCSPHQHNF